MASICGAVEVRSLSSHRSRGSLRSLQSAGTPEAITDLFRVDVAEGSATEGRAQKRRKLERDASVGLRSEDAFDPSESVVLASVVLDLHLPKALKPLKVPETSQTTIPLSLASFHRVDVQEFTVSLWNPAFSSGLDVTAAAAPELLESFAPHLDTGASLSTTSLPSSREGEKRWSGKQRKRSNRAGPPFCRCTLSAPAPGQHSLRLVCEVRWRVGTSVLEGPGHRDSIRMDMKILEKYLPDDTREAKTPWALSDFYDAVHVPLTSENVSPRLQVKLNETGLYPFQQRAVDWLLRREGVAYSASGDLQSGLDEATGHVPVSFKPTHDATGKPCYVSHLRGMIVSDLSWTGDAGRILRGGILAEEMGLGKTVELIALISHHKRETPEEKVRDPYLGTHVTPSGATLIITPPSILEQWKQEIATHAPELKVLHYKGLPPPSAPRKEHEEATVENLLRFDIVLTTYNVLSKEIHFATPPPDRSLRHAKVHERRMSPLVEISWWRVCLDEAQMVESGVSQAATVARIIPRCNAWAVSGTPLRKDIQDLRGLLIFLRYDPFARSKAIWDRLDKPSFRAIFNQIALRHSKDKIRDELRLPPQKRIVITVPFTAIEDQNYSEMMRQMCQACFLSQEGIPLRDDKGPDHPEVIERMREWLVRLRQTCLHAHVGRRNRKALGGKNVPLRTVDEVLEVMIEQNDTSLKAEARELILAHMMRGHIQANAKNIERRSVIALSRYREALEITQLYVNMCREELALAKEKLRSTVPVTDGSDDLSEDEEDIEQRDKTGRIAVFQRTVRSFLELEHACHFFMGNMYYQIHSNTNLTEPGSEEFLRLEQLEEEAYAKAKYIRQELLKQPLGRAQSLMKKIKENPLSSVRQYEDLPDLGGIESRRVLQMMDTIMEVMNRQAVELSDWRSRIVDILRSPLVDQDENKAITGDEYEDSTKAQDKLYVYVMALRTLIADRNTAVHGMQDLLIEHEFQGAMRQAREKDEDKRGHAPELVLEFGASRLKNRPKESDGSLKGVVSAARSLITALQWKADAGDDRAVHELGIAQRQLKDIQAIFSEQEKGIAELEKEQDLFRATMNQRLEFYRQLQHISDTVAPWKDQLDEMLDIMEYQRQAAIIDARKKSLAGWKTKHAYLTNLRSENQKGGVKPECIICQDEFEVGVLTSCGHKYCKDCINQWWHQHRTCPLCKQRLGSRDFKDITFKPTEVTAQEESHEATDPSQPSTPSSANSSIYSDISDSMMKEIKMIDLDGSFGSKVDMISRHLFWIRRNDPGAKSIIFSQFADFLEVLREAFRKWKIGTSAIADKHGIDRFKSDPAVECFLLDAKSDSSGLNLVNATYVFLCEPLINPAIELQAIARVHRIGQQRLTSVFMYLVSDTVEEAIYDISVARRLEHMSRSTSSQSGTATPVLQEKTLDAANSMELEAAPLKQLIGKKGDGEVVLAGDLWTCLFGKPRKQSSAVLNREVGRQLRAEAAEIRAAGGGVTQARRLDPSLDERPTLPR
ncbi:hypothetical protein K458DRAFT_337770 [Lentithecium fluviatile CBS 122367]|uniref:ATP-dependent DNA helicase n=1 Tax=Lentithecium fluviatile CBS 122367 TaxID=1168545 RepID=A0A6G1J2U5_9PLEO|nr:hypothetical protein K458DRAFT_337770 [Lentithecium fluviatile CBS 122367]